MNNLTQNTQSAKDAPKATITIETPASTDVQVKDAPKAKGKKQTDAAKINLLEKAAKKAGNDITVSIAPKSKKSTVKKDTPKVKDAEPKAKVEVMTKVETEKVDLSKVAPLVVPKELLASKIDALGKKLLKEKRETTKSPFHVAYGYFLAKTKAGNVVRLEYHESLRPTRWLARNDKGEILGTPDKTMHGLHQIVVNQF